MPELGTSGFVGGPGWATTQVYPPMKPQQGGCAQFGNDFSAEMRPNWAAELGRIWRL